MAIPTLSNQNILDALKYIDEKGVPFHNQSYKYELIHDEKKYPPKYVIAVAIHLATGQEIATDNFKAIDAKTFLESLDFVIETKAQEKFLLSIKANSIESTDERFNKDNLGLGDDYKILDVIFKKSNGEIVKRKYEKGEKKISNQTMARIACQLFEEKLASLSLEEKESFPICQYKPNSELIQGIYSSVEEFKNHRKTLEFMRYYYDNRQRMFVFYCWNIFSTIRFVQECLKRFGDPDDQFILSYREKDKNELNDKEEIEEIENNNSPQKQQTAGFRNKYSSILLESRNIIFRGAPGTGKSFLAKEIAADIISDGLYDKASLLPPEMQKQMEFVQFHPSYDYSDFVEGLKPKVNDDGSMGFELKEGIFKKFVSRARKNYEEANKTLDIVKKEQSVRDAIEDFFSGIELGVDIFKTITNNEFLITSFDDEHIYISIPNNPSVNKLTLNLDEIRKMLEADQEFVKIKDITLFFGKNFATQAYSYDFAIYKAIKEKQKTAPVTEIKQESKKRYIFIIDEINRGDISKIFGELFYSIDPGNRGKDGEILTQYSNLHADPEDKFYIPENVYIIGTMNDIDRSVDSFDFAMRRRFRFIEIKPDERMDMLSDLQNEDLKNDAIRRMTALNEAIVKTPDLNENYQIGASYFLKLKMLTSDQLWTDYLKPLLQEYIHGMYDEEGIMKKFEKAYGYEAPVEGNQDDSNQNQ